ncbi:MAG TPA: ABC transporter permease [Vicinamibacterales bacterium]|nr:ABC transporter permease [Vicinamibacterales bacterium]
MANTFAQDFAFALRGLWRAKAFTASAVLTLSIGLAGTIAMSALIRGVLLRPLPVHQQDRLIVSWKELRTAGSARYPFGNTEIEAVARASRFLESAAGVDRNGVERSVVIDDGTPGYANIGLVTGRFFDVLGVRPTLGRGFVPDDDNKGAEDVVVISSGWWQRHYGRSPDVIGHRIRVDNRTFTIVGVMPADLDYPAGIEIWRTTNSVPDDGPFGDAARREVNLVGRPLQITIAQGRPFRDSDNDTSSPVAIVSEDIAAQLWPGQNPIGKRFKLGTPASREQLADGRRGRRAKPLPHGEDARADLISAGNAIPDDGHQHRGTGVRTPRPIDVRNRRAAARDRS